MTAGLVPNGSCRMACARAPDLVLPEKRKNLLLACIQIFNSDGAAEYNSVRFRAIIEIDYLASCEAVLEVPNTRLNKGLFFFGVRVFGVFRQVSMAQGNFDLLDDPRPFHADQPIQLLSQFLVSF